MILEAALFVFVFLIIFNSYS